MALCAVALVSFTTARDAQARLRVVEPPAPVIQPVVTDETQFDEKVRIEPLPPTPAPADGTFTGKMIVD